MFENSFSINLKEEQGLKYPPVKCRIKINNMV